MIRLAFDASSLAAANKSGVAYYAAGVIQHLADTYPDDVQIVGHYCNFLGRRKITGLPQAPNITYRPTILLSSRTLNLLRRIGLWIPFELLIKGRADFHYFPSFIGWPSLLGTPSAPVIHDITYLRYPELVSNRALHDMRRFVPLAIKRARFVITISKVSANLIQAEYDLQPERTLITHIPPLNVARLDKRAVAGHLQDLSISDPYILFLGNLEPRKNLVTLLAAYKLLKPEFKQKFSLVLAGGKGWHDEAIVTEIKRLQATGHKIILPGYVSEEQRAALFEGATTFVLPSLYEGFGMTLLEAMKYKLPLIASDIPIFHEVCGKSAALFFDPQKPSELAERLEVLLASPALQKQLVAAGTKNLKRYSWQAVTEAFYDRLVV